MDKLVVHPECAPHWIIESVSQAEDGWLEVVARPVPVPPFRCALEREGIGAAMILRPSMDPQDQYGNAPCAFYLEPEFAKGHP
jgi:hypothetical protein